MSIALTYGKSMEEAIDMGSVLAASVITSYDNVCPRFQPGELGLDVQI
jgi:pseudouridine kinase